MNTFKNLKFLFVAALSAVILLGLFLSAVMAQSMTGNSILGSLDAGLTLAPDNAANADPGATVHYTHTLINVGDMPDVVTITVSSSPGFTAIVEPEMVPLDIGNSVIVTATVTVTSGMPAGTEGVTIITAISGNDSLISATATNTTTVNALYGMAISPGSIRSADPGALVAYWHTITNTGNTTDTITLFVESDSGFVVDFEQPSPLAQASSVLVTVTLAVPEDTPAYTTDIMTVTATSSNSSLVTASATNTTTVNLVANVLLNPGAQSQNASPGSLVPHPYMITNAGNFTDTYTLTADSSQGYGITLSANQLMLGPSTSENVTVTVAIPLDAEAGTTDETVLVVVSGNDPSLTAVVTSTTHVSLVSIVTIIPDNEGFIAPGQTVLYTHTVTNHSNRTETVLLTAISSREWAVIVQPTNLTLNRDASGIVTVTISVPFTALEGMSDTTVVTATLASGHNDAAYNVTTVRRHYLYLPVVTQPANWEPVGDNWPAEVAALSFAICPTDNTKIVAGGLGANAKVWALDGTSWIPAEDVPGGFSVAAVVMNHTCDKVYVSLYDKGIWQGVWSGANWTWSQMGGDEVKLVRTLALAGDRLFAGGEFGIRYWESNAWQGTSGVDTAQPVMHISAGDPTDANSLLYAVQWQNSKIYYAPGNVPSAWNLLPLPDLPDALTRAVFGTSETVRFVGTNNSSYQLVNNNWAQISIPAGLRSAVIDGDTAYLGYNLNTGVYKLQGGVLTPVDAGWSTKPEFVYVLALAEGQLYAATTTGVWVYQRP